MKKILLGLSLLVACAVMSASTAAADQSTNGYNPADTGKPALPTKGSGVAGSVDRGPVKPTTLPGQKNTAPVAGAEVVALDDQGKEVARTKTDKKGNYELKLAPGKYTLVGPTTGIPPRKFKKEIEVKKSWQRQDMHLDSGIR